MDLKFGAGGKNQKYKYAKKTCSLQRAGEGKKRGEKIQNTQEKNTWQIVVCNGSHFDVRRRGGDGGKGEKETDVRKIAFISSYTRWSEVS